MQISTGSAIKLNLLFSGTILLSSCDMYRPCARAICGCWDNTTYRYQTKILDSRSFPVEGIELHCPDTGERLGVTDKYGAISIRFRTQTSPGCGISTCAKLGVVQNQEHIGYLNLRLSKSHVDTLRIEDIADQKYETFSSSDDV